MADYIYLLQTRLTPAQQSALQHVRDAARSRAMTVFLVGGAVRDMTTGAQIRDLDFAIQGNATKLKKDLQKAGGTLIGEDEATQALFFNFPGGVRLEAGSTLSVTYPKPGKPVYKPATILDDLRRRDFTANAMAISLNDGSYGLLMDPLNGVADLENRELRLVSNYGFIEDPARMIRAARFSARLGWQLEEKTAQRYETGKAEGYISSLGSASRKYELEEVFHEEDPLRVLRRLEQEGWAKVLTPVWTSAKANESELNRLRDLVGQMESMGIFPDASAAYFPLLTAKLAPKEVATLKSSFARPGFAEQIDALEGETKAFAAVFSGKSAAAPSEAWKLLFSSPPEPVLWLAHTTKSAPLQAKFQAFFNVWSQARNRIPYQLMQEMRIVPTLPGYDALLDTLFFAVMDGKLDTPEDAKAFLEPFSPPAPPPPVNLRRRAVKRETKPAKPRSKKPVAEANAVETEIEVATLPVAEAAAAKPGAAKPVAKVPVAKVPVAKVPVSSPGAKAGPSAIRRAVPAPTKKSTPAKSVAKKSAVVAKKSAKTASKHVVKKAIAKATAKKAKVVAKKAVAKKTVAKRDPQKTVASPRKSKPILKPVVKKVAKPAPKKASRPVAKPKPKTRPKSKTKR